jgi:hypothetical protein
MTGRRRTQLAEQRADLILASEPGLHAYAVHFEAQMRRGTIRRVLYASYLHFACAGAILAGVDPRRIW